MVSIIRGAAEYAGLARCGGQAPQMKIEDVEEGERPENIGNEL